MKSGIRTTEFWAVIIAGILVAAGSEIGITLDATQMSAIVSLVLGYILNRYLLKKQDNNEEKK